MKLRIPEGLSHTDFLRLFLWKIGVSTVIRVKYPGIDKEFKVHFNHVWRQLEKGMWEPKQIEKIIELTRKSTTVADIGAWEGPYSLLLSFLVGADGFVYSFEPDPKAREILVSNLILNEIRNVKVLSDCVSDSSGKALLRSVKWGNSASSIVIYSDQDRVRSLVVRTVSLDEYFSSGRLAGMKIDAQGAELKILSGARSVINRDHPWIVLEYEGQYLESLEERKETLLKIEEFMRSSEILEQEANGRTILLSQ